MWVVHCTNHKSCTDNTMFWIVKYSSIKKTETLSKFATFALPIKFTQTNCANIGKRAKYLNMSKHSHFH